MVGEAEHDVTHKSNAPTILIIDDDPATLSTLSEYLGRYNLRVLVAPNGEAGINCARQAAPDLILLDLLMPDMHGFEICRRLKADAVTRDIPVIFLMVLIDVQARGLAARSDEQIFRPFRCEELLGWILLHLNSPTPARGLGAENQALRAANEALTIQLEEHTAALARAEAALQQQFDARQHAEDRLRQYVRRVVDAQEAERDHIARELHDEIGQALALIKMNVRAVQRLAHESQLAPHLEQSLAMIEETLQRVRTLALDLRPSMLDDLGLVTTLRWYVERHAQWAGLAADISVDSFETRIPRHLETVCFRVAQEALSNVARHAQARTVRIRLWQREGGVHMLIRDDGIGFDVLGAQERAADGASMGLPGMEDRVMLVGGQLAIESAPCRGTTIWLRLPLQKGAPAGEPATQEQE